MFDDVTKIACHKDATAGAKVATVKPGGTVEITWNTWPESHVGPIIDYLAAVPDATAATSKDLSFFKIDEAGFEAGQWAASKLLADNLTWTVTIPESIKDGQYVLRHEIIALHSAGQANGAQAYPKCININVEGGSGTETPAGVTADKLYTATDPGILVNIYSGDQSAYKIPGPALFSGASSGSGSSSNASAPAASAPAASAPAATSAAAAASSPVIQNNAVSSAAPSATATAAPTQATGSAPASTGGASIADKEFTLDTFVAWLEEKAGSSSSTKARRHSRAFRA